MAGADGGAGQPPAVAKPVKEAVGELTDALASLDTAWAALEAAERALSDALWTVLVEKKTDMMVAAVRDEATELTRLASEWTGRLSDQHDIVLLNFDDALPEPWPKQFGDSTAALASGVAALEAWGGGDGAASRWKGR